MLIPLSPNELRIGSLKGGTCMTRDQATSELNTWRGRRRDFNLGKAHYDGHKLTHTSWIRRRSRWRLRCGHHRRLSSIRCRCIIVAHRGGELVYVVGYRSNTITWIWTRRGDDLQIHGPLGYHSFVETPAHTHYIPAVGENALTPKYRSLRSNWRSIRQDCKHSQKGRRHVV